MLKKSSVLVLTSTFPRNKNDWWGRFIYDLHSQMNSIKTTVIAPHSPISNKQERLENLHVFRFSYFYPHRYQLLTTGSGALKSTKNSFIIKIQLLLFPISQFILMIKLLLKNKYDIIHAHWIIPQGLNGLLAKLLFKKKLIITVHGTDIFALKKLNFLKKIILDNCDLCTVNSSETFKEVKRLSTKVKIIIIPMGVDTSLFKPDKTRKNSLTVLGVGRFIKWKGFDFLIRAFAKLTNDFPKAKLVLVGSGPEKRNLEKIAGKSTFFYDNCDHKILASLYQSADLFVCPSIHDKKTGEREAQGVVIAEALACTVPVVATATGGIPDIIKDRQTGLLAKEKDSEDLYQKMKELLKNKSLSKTCRQNGLKLVKKNYSQTTVSQKYFQAYKGLLKVLK